VRKLIVLLDSIRLEGCLWKTLSLFPLSMEATVFTETAEAALTKNFSPLNIVPAKLNEQMDFVDIFHAKAEPARVCLFTFLDWRDLFILARTCRSFRKTVKVLQKNPPYAKPFGDEVVIQRLTKYNIEWNFLEDGESNKNANNGVTVLGSPRTVLGPTGRMDALEVSRVGQAIRLENPITLGDEWTISTFTFIHDGSPLRTGFKHPEGYREGEHALVGSVHDDQQIFYSEQRGGYIGCFLSSDEDIDAISDRYYTAFFPSFAGFNRAAEGWHHLAAVGSTSPHNNCGWTTYYLDGRAVGTVSYNLKTPIAYIGNASEECDLTQPWGLIADFRVFARALPETELSLIVSGGM